MNDGWEVFQRDVLDVFRQYEGYFDFFERIGNLSDSRPDCFARITREKKKEVWIVDAKNKAELGEDDLERMEKYLDMVRKNPIDVGLELSELSDHEVRGIFVTGGKTTGKTGFEAINFNRLHQFLQRELVYTDTEKVVRDVAKMVERKQLSQSQARLLFGSIKPFESRLEQGLKVLEELEQRFVGLGLEKPPIESYEHDIPVDAVARHSEREQVFLFDIPYSRGALEAVDEKVGEIRRRLEDTGNVYYSAINTFGSRESSYLVSPGEVEEEVKKKAGIVSPDEVLSLFTPKIPVEKEYGDGYLEVRDQSGIGFRARVESSDDVEHRIEVLMPEDAVSRLNDGFLNARRLGEIHGNRFRERLKFTESLEVAHSQGRESWDSFKDAVRSLYQPSVNPVLGKKASSKV